MPHVGNTASLGVQKYILIDLLIHIMVWLYVKCINQFCWV